MNTIKKILLLLLVFSLFVSLLSISSYADGNKDITTTTVEEDLASMGEDKLTNLSPTKNIFLGMSQCIVSDSSGQPMAKTYVYVNWIGSTTSDLNIALSCAVSGADKSIEETYTVYKLKLCDKYETWCKYEVTHASACNGVKCLNVCGLPNKYQTTRRFVIREIYDDSKTNSIELDETRIFNGFVNEDIKVFKEEYETITITNKEVHFITTGKDNWWQDVFRKNEGVCKDNVTYPDCWFVFFNTDKEMLSIEEIDIQFIPYTYRFLSSSKTVRMDQVFTDTQIATRLGELYEAGYSLEQHYLYYLDRQIVTIKPGKTSFTYGNDWWMDFRKDIYECDNIIKLSNYQGKTDSENNPFVFDEFAGKYEWGVMFYTSRKYTKSEDGGTIVEAQGVNQTAILRIKYLSATGEVVNALAIDTPTDEFTGSAAIIGGLNDWLNDVKNSLGDWTSKLSKILPMILAAFVLLILGPYILPFIMPVLKILITGFIKIFKFVINLILVPIKALTKRKRE